MKRYLLLLMLFIGFFSYLLYPLRMADAAEDNLFLGKPVVINGATLMNATDGDVNTYSDIKISTMSMSNINLNLKRIVVKYITETGAYGGNWTVTYTDGTTLTGALYRTDWALSTVTINTNYDKVVKSFSMNVTGGFRWQIREFEGYGMSNPADPADFVINNVTASGTPTSALLKWDAIKSAYLAGYKVYNDTKLIGTVGTNSFNVTGLTPTQTYVFKVSGYDTWGKEYLTYSVMYSAPEPDTKPPGIPVGITVVPDRNSAVVKFTKPSDDDYAGVYVYLGDQLVNNSPTLGDSYQINGLDPNKPYRVQLQSVDTSGNKSAKTAPVDFKTLELKSPPAQVSNLSASSLNGAALLTWSPVQSATSYKVYQDSKLVSNVTGTSYRAVLINGQRYQFYLVSVNDAGDSPKSNIAVATPSINKATEVTLGYSLTSVATGTTSWFASIWLILAFSISIPLAFYIANRVKGLFVG